MKEQERYDQEALEAWKCRMKKVTNEIVSHKLYKAAVRKHVWNTGISAQTSHSIYTSISALASASLVIRFTATNNVFPPFKRYNSGRSTRSHYGGKARNCYACTMMWSGKHHLWPGKMPFSDSDVGVFEIDAEISWVGMWVVVGESGVNGVVPGEGLELQGESEEVWKGLRGGGLKREGSCGWCLVDEGGQDAVLISTSLL